MAPRETDNNAYAKFRSDQQTVLWPDDVSGIFWSGQLKFTLLGGVGVGALLSLSGIGREVGWGWALLRGWALINFLCL